MEIKQFYDKDLAHASYAILSEGEIALIDPARDPMEYYNFANENKAVIKAVIETHPHADFISSHAEIAKTTGAVIYVNPMVSPGYDYTAFEDGSEVKIGSVTLKALATPGHSPDSISILIIDEKGTEHAIATGDTLFVGDVGRPDLREKAGAVNYTRAELAKMMYNTIHEKLLKLNDYTIVYPAHGPGSLCGKTTSTDKFTTIGRERIENYAFQPMSEDEFVDVLLKDQSYIPKYFGYDVELNRKGAPELEASLRKIPTLDKNPNIPEGVLIVDARTREDFMKGHIPGAWNIREDGKMETWIGSIIAPDEKFYIVVSDDASADRVLRRIAKIGYEANVEGVMKNPDKGLKILAALDLKHFEEKMDDYNILDVRNKPETDKGKIFEKAVIIPLHELRERADEVPVNKPLVIHCGGGYRSTIAASILEKKISIPVFDLGEAINKFNKKQNA